MQKYVKQLILMLSVCMTIILVLSSAGIFDALLAFMLIGAIPGTSYSLPPGAMMTLAVLALWLITIRFAAVPIIGNMRINRLARHYLERKERLPKRRFSQI